MNPNTQPTVPNVPPSNVNTAVNQQKNTMAVVALILSIGGLVIFVSGIVGFILGIMALKRSKSLNNDGRGLSIASIIIGAITGFFIFLLIILLAIPALQKNAQK